MSGGVQVVSHTLATLIIQMCNIPLPSVFCLMFFFICCSHLTFCPSVRRSVNIVTKQYFLMTSVTFSTFISYNFRTKFTLKRISKCNHLSSLDTLCFMAKMSSLRFYSCELEISMNTLKKMSSNLAQTKLSDTGQHVSLQNASIVSSIN